MIETTHPDEVLCATSYPPDRFKTMRTYRGRSHRRNHFQFSGQDDTCCQRAIPSKTTPLYLPYCYVQIPSSHDSRQRVPKNSGDDSSLSHRSTCPRSPHGSNFPAATEASATLVVVPSITPWILCFPNVSRHTNSHSPVSNPSSVSPVFTRLPPAKPADLRDRGAFPRIRPRAASS